MGVTRVPIAPELLTWAQQRGGHDDEVVRRRFPTWDRWVAGEGHPTVRQAEAFARFSHVPFGTLLLPEPPGVRLPIQDFRQGRAERGAEPSQDLLDVIHQSQRRQDWYRDYAERHGLRSRGFLRGDGPSDIVGAAALLRSELGFEVAQRADLGGVEDARKALVQRFEALGGLGVVTSMVGNDTHRMLDVEEVRGFTLHDAVAPLVFVNAADSMRGQIFSLAHEFAHVLRGDTGISAEDELAAPDSNVERWCNAVAADFLVPEVDLRHRAVSPVTPQVLTDLSSVYLCSTLVVLIRLKESGWLAADEFDRVYTVELRRLAALATKRPSSGGGNFYDNQPFRIGRTLSRAVLADTQEGITPPRDALRLLGFASLEVMDRYSAKLGIR